MKAPPGVTQWWALRARSALTTTARPAVTATAATATLGLPGTTRQDRRMDTPYLAAAAAAALRETGGSSLRWERADRAAADGKTEACC